MLLAEVPSACLSHAQNSCSDRSMDVGMDSEQLEDDVEVGDDLGGQAAAEEAFEDDDVLSTEEEGDDQDEEVADEEVDEEDDEEEEDDDERPASRKRGASVDVSRLTRRQRTLYDNGEAPGGADSSGAEPRPGQGGSVPWHEMLLPKELDYSWKPKGGKLPSEMNEVEALKRQEALERRRQRALNDKRDAEENIKAKLRKGLTAKFRKRGGGRGGRGAGAATGGAGGGLGEHEGASQGPAPLAPGFMRLRCTPAGNQLCWGARVHPSALPVPQQVRPPLQALDVQLQLLPASSEPSTSGAGAAAGGGGATDKERCLKTGAKLLLVPAGVEWQQVRLKHRQRQQQQGKPPGAATPAAGKGSSGTGMGKTILKLKPRLKVPGADSSGTPGAGSPSAGSRVSPPEGCSAHLACLAADTLQVVGWLPPAAEQQLQEVLAAADLQGQPSPPAAAVAPARAGVPPTPPPATTAATAAQGQGTPAPPDTPGAAVWLRLWQQGALQRLQLRVQSVQRPSQQQQQQQQQEQQPPYVALWQVQEHLASTDAQGGSCGTTARQLERVWVRVRAGMPPVAAQ